MEAHNNSLVSIHCSAKGRGLYTRRSIAENVEVIMESTSLLFVVSDHEFSSTCLSCLQLVPKDNSDIMFCNGKCQQVFCSTACQQPALHRLECEAVSALQRAIAEREIPMEDTSELRLLIRLILTEDKVPPAVYDLTDNLDRVTPEDRWHIEAQTDLVMRVLNLPEARKEFVMRNLLRLVCNSIGLQRGNGTKYAVGIFPKIAMVNHSCFPNCCIRATGEKNSLTLDTLRPLKEGEEILHSYTDIYQPMAVRRSALQQTYSFLCDCERCQEGSKEANEFEQIVCGVRISAEACQDEKKRSREILIASQRAAQRFSAALGALEAQQMSLAKTLFEQFLLEQKEKLADTHHLLKNALVHLSAIYRAEEGGKAKAFECLLKALEMEKRVWPASHEHLRQYDKLMEEISIKR